MTLSNKILIVFFGSILAYTLMAFSEIRIKGDTRFLSNENSVTESISFSNIRYIQFDEGFEEQVNISSSANPQMKIKSRLGQLKSNLKYDVKNDTLFLRSFDETENRYELAIEVSNDGFNGFSSVSASIYVADIVQTNLSINQSGGRVELMDVTIESLSIESTMKSYMQVSNAIIDTLSVDLNHSTIRLHDKINLIQGTLSNEADLYSTGANEIQLKRDKTSSMRIF